MLKFIFVAAALSATIFVSGCSGGRMESDNARSTLDCQRSLSNVREARAEVAELRADSGLMGSFVPKRLTSNGRALRRAELQLSVLENDYRSGCA